jgi:hypothetical protein
MFSWEWEDFEEVVRKYGPIVEDAGPLSTPVQHFTIQRDESLQLRMLTHAPVGAKDSTVSYPSGTVRENTDRVTFASNTGLKMVAEGVHATETRTIWQSDPPVAELQQDCSIHRLNGSLDPGNRETTCVIDWLANVSPSFHWPDMTDEVSGIKRTRQFGRDPNRLEMNSSNFTEGGSWNCVRLTVGECTLFLATARSTVAANIKRPGYIVYLGCPTDEFRDRIRRCLSFALGSYLIYLGHSCFCTDWCLTHFEAMSAYSMTGRAFDVPPMPPFPLGLQWEWQIDREMLSRAVNALYEHYEDLNFGPLSWAYWHAVMATPHIAGVHYGAAIESLERAYLDTKGGKIERSVVDAANWEPLKSALERQVKDAILGEDVTKILTNKIRNLNAMPQSMLTTNLMKSLGLALGAREEKALRIRNISAHGKDEEVDVEWIRDLKILRVRFHRMVIAMTGASDQYYDYFTTGRPTRGLNEAIPE